MSGTMEDYQAALRASVVYFPVVGGMLGLFTGCVFVLGCKVWSPMIAALIAIGLEAWITGAFHEDALADATDALGGGWTREQVLEILKDSRHGTYGVMALIIGVGLRIATIASLSGAWSIVVIGTSAAVGRWAILWMMASLPPINDRHTMARDVGSQPGLKTILGGAVLPFILGSLLLVWSPARVVVALTASIVLTFLFSRYIKKRVGGITGDFLGCTCYLVQLICLTCFAIK